MPARQDRAIRSASGLEPASSTVFDTATSSPTGNTARSFELDTNTCSLYHDEHMFVRIALIVVVATFLGCVATRSVESAGPGAGRTSCSQATRCGRSRPRATRATRAKASGSSSAGTTCGDDAQPGPAARPALSAARSTGSARRGWLTRRRSTSISSSSAPPGRCRPPSGRRRLSSCAAAGSASSSTAARGRSDSSCARAWG